MRSALIALLVGCGVSGAAVDAGGTAADDVTVLDGDTDGAADEVLGPQGDDDASPGASSWDTLGGASDATSPAADVWPRSGGPVGFALAPPDQAEAPDADTVYGGAVFDTNLDGRPDVVLATNDGLRILVADTFGRFSLARVVDAQTGAFVPLRPGGQGAVRSVAVGRFGTRDELIACTDGAAELRFVGTLTGLASAGGLPVRDGSCLSVAVADANGDGAADVVTLVQRGGKVALGTWLSPELNADPSVLVAAGPALPVGELLPAGATGSVFERIDDETANGRGAGRLTAVVSPDTPWLEASVPLTAETPWPTRFRLRVKGDGTGFVVQPMLVGADGSRQLGPALSLTDGAWQPVVAETSAWEGSAEAIVGVGIRVSLPDGVESPVAGRVFLDDLVLELPGRMPLAAATFDPAPRFTWPDAHTLLTGALDGDASADFVVLRSKSAPVVLRSYGGRVGSPLSAGGQVGFSAGALLDADGDGDLDVFLASPAGQDRLLVGDGYGQFLDTTAGAIPVDGAQGTAVVARDFDGDGDTDLVIGNRGGTDRHYRARGDGRFTDATPWLGFDALDTAVVLALDIDGDGDDDLMSVASDGNVTPLVRVSIPQEGAP